MVVAGRSLALVAALTFAFALSACGSAKKPGFQAGTLSAKDLATVADKTSAIGGARIAMQQTMKLGSQGTLPSSVTGVVDVANRRGEMTASTDVGGLARAGSGDGGKLDEDIVFDGLTLYMKSVAFDQLLPAGKHWLKLDLDKLGQQVGIDMSALTQGSSGDPTQVLQYLKAASGDVTRVGTETVRGEPTAHYKATVDFNKLPDAVPAGQRAAMRTSIRQVIKLSGSSTAPMEVWIGDDGIARRIVDTITTNIAGQTAKITQRVELYDFGTKVDVTIPSADDTYDMSKLGGLSQGDSAGAGGLFG